MSSIAISFNAAILGVLLLCLLFHDAAAEWVETAKLTDSDGEEGDHFGYSVATDNGILVVGTYGYGIGVTLWAGSATIFEWSDGEWVARQKLRASDTGRGDEFGRSVAISNGVVAVGAPFEDDGGFVGFNAGAVYIYSKGAGGVWTERQKLIHSDAAAGDWFGWSLAMHGNTLIVGARGDDLASGSVYVFALSSDIWTQVAKLRGSDLSAGDEFGHSVAIDLDTILVGARLDNDLGLSSGSACVFQRDGQGGSWTQVAKLTPIDGQPRDHFGRAVALEGGTTFVGSLNNVDGENVGAVYQFGEDGGGTWTQQNKLVAHDFAANDFFGYGLAFRNGTLVVGVDGENSGTGAVYVFQQVSSVWTQRAKLVGSDGAAGDSFGYAVDVDDGMVFAGAHGDNSWQGSVYAFETVVPMPTMQPSQYPSMRHAAKSSVTPSTQPTRRSSEQPAAPVSTQSFGLQPVVIVVFVGIAFLAGGVAVCIYSRRNNRPAIPDQHTPQNDHRVVITDDISELGEPSLAIGIRSVEASAVSKVYTLDAGTPTIDHSQETSAAP